MSTQYLRKAQLIVSPTLDAPGVDLSELHFKFAIKRGDLQTPNSADIRIYNLDEQTAKSIQEEKSQIILQAGYEGLPGDSSNFGIIFTGFINQRRLGRESAVDTFVDIIADDGAFAYNFGVINTSLKAGSTTKDHVNAAAKAMEPYGVALGKTPEFTGTGLPRGKVMFGMARDVMRTAAMTSATNWSIQDGKITMVPLTSYNPGNAVVLNSATGLIGFPEQTFGGIRIRSLLNSNIKVNSIVQIDQKALQGIIYPLDLASATTAKSFTPSVNDDGLYNVIYAEHFGDTRGNEWYTDMVCLAVDSSVTPPSLVPKLVGVAPDGPVKQYG